MVASGYILLVPNFPSCRFLVGTVVFIAVMAVASAKEFYDRRKRGGHFCVWDLLADLCGTVSGIMYAWGILWYFKLSG